MKNKVLALASCIAATAPSTSFANLIPENIVGLNLGEISSSSFLNQPFKGVIPLLFGSYENSKALKVSLAPASAFDKIGAEKHPILESLSFQVVNQNNKAVILISSNKPIQLPFLNFVLEIQGPKGSIYQDYTVLLDPETKQVEEFEANYVDSSATEFETSTIEGNELEIAEITKTINTSNDKLMANFVAKTKQVDSNSLSYIVKKGDSLSKIAQQHRSNKVSLQTISHLIYQKNPKAFIRGNSDRIKSGVVISLPSATEIMGFEIASKSIKAIKKPINNATPEIIAKTTYTVVKGDSLSKITKKFVNKDTSYTKLMSAIYSTNPDAFLTKNLIKAGVEITIPSFSNGEPKSKQVVISHDIQSKSKDVYTDENQYKIKDGDTLYSITKEMGYRGNDFGKMQRAIFVENPEAFVDGNINQLEIGAVITLPIIDEIAQATENKSSSTTTVTKTNTKPVANTATMVNPAPSDLIKRIRELRKELKQANSNLSEMQKNLSNKEILLHQKNIQVNSLNEVLVKLSNNEVAGALTATALKTAIEPEKSSINKIEYKPLSESEMAERKRDLEHKKVQTQALLSRADEIKSHVISPYSADTSMYSALPFIKDMSKANMAYLSAALFLGLLLIRYRRELYQLTYSAINFDQPKYYPAPAADIYELKETNINFHDPKMDEDASNYEFVSDKPNTKADFEIKNVENEVLINPLLVEATEDIFEKDNESAEVEECENLVTELFDEFKIKEDKQDNEKWQDIEEVCDKYIKKVNKSVRELETDEKEPLVDGATDLNDMMSDLVESLGKVEKSVKKNKVAKASYPELLHLTKPKPEEEKKDLKT